MKRRFVVAAPFLAGCGAPLLLAPAPVAQAAEQWCETDPLVVVRTPGGAVVPLFVTTAAPALRYLPHIVAAGLHYRTEPALEGKATRVSLEVRVPDSVRSALTLDTAPAGESLALVAPTPARDLLGTASPAPASDSAPAPVGDSAPAVKEAGQAESTLGRGLVGPLLRRREDFPIRSTVSTGPLRTGMVLATAEGRSGRATTLQFVLHVP